MVISLRFLGGQFIFSKLEKALFGLRAVFMISKEGNANTCNINNDIKIHTAIVLKIIGFGYISL